MSQPLTHASGTNEPPRRQGRQGTRRGERGLRTLLFRSGLGDLGVLAVCFPETSPSVKDAMEIEPPIRVVAVQPVAAAVLGLDLEVVAGQGLVGPPFAFEAGGAARV